MCVCMSRELERQNKSWFSIELVLVDTYYISIHNYTETK